MRKILMLAAIIVGLTAFTGCFEQKGVTKKVVAEKKGATAIVVPAGFDFKSEKDVAVSIKAAAGAEVSIYDQEPADGIDARIVTYADESGNVDTDLNLEKDVESVYVSTGGKTTKVDVVNGSVSGMIAAGAAKRATKGLTIATYNQANTTIVFEDKWPSKGDYDFNDVAIQYNYKATTINKKLTELTLNYKVLGNGANEKDGFAFKVDNITSDFITSVTGDGVLDGDVVVLVNNAKDEFAGTEFGNTIKGSYVATNWHTVKVKFADSIVVKGAATLKDLFNPFLFKTENTGLEVHLPAREASFRASDAYANTIDDVNGFYQTKEGLPWAIEVPGIFAYPVEKADITTAYTKFADWAASGGEEYKSWYKNKNYINAELTYTK